MTGQDEGGCLRSSIRGYLEGPYDHAKYLKYHQQQPLSPRLVQMSEEFEIPTPPVTPAKHLLEGSKKVKQPVARSDNEDSQ